MTFPPGTTPPGEGETKNENAAVRVIRATLRGDHAC